MTSNPKIYQYGAHPRQGVAEYSIETTTSPGSNNDNGTIATTSKEKHDEAIFFIHGGLWRDPSNTYKDWESFVPSFIKDKHVFSIDYRVDLELKHPGHLQDVVRAINLALRENKHIEKICLVGHSVGATLVTQLLTVENFPLEEQLEYPEKIKKVALLDGIYNIDSYVKEYPDCESMVRESFLFYENTTALTSSSNEGSKLDRWQSLEKILIMHSTEDELLSTKQANELIDWLHKNDIKNNYQFILQDFGKHNQVYINPQCCSLIATSF